VVLGMVLAAILAMVLATILGKALAAVLVIFRAFVTAARPFAAFATVVTMVMVVVMMMVFVFVATVFMARVFAMVATPLVPAMCVAFAPTLPSRCLSRYPQRICR
jgi:hypothetical protein